MVAVGCTSAASVIDSSSVVCLVTLSPLAASRLLLLLIVMVMMSMMLSAMATAGRGDCAWNRPSGMQESDEYSNRQQRRRSRTDEQTTRLDERREAVPTSEFGRFEQAFAVCCPLFQ